MWNETNSNGYIYIYIYWENKIKNITNTFTHEFARPSLFLPLHLATISSKRLKP